MMAGMLTEGTKTRSAQQIASQTESLGADLSSGGGLESSSVTVNVMPDKLAAAMAIMADVAMHPAFAAEELERQREQALDGLRVAYEQPGSVAGFAGAPVIYGGTPFGHAVQGTPDSLPKLKPADLAALHQVWFRPDNAILVLTGDITRSRASRWRSKRSAAGPNRPRRCRRCPPSRRPPSRGGGDRHPRHRPGLGQRGQAAIARNDPAYYPGVVAATVLGGGYSARPERRDPHQARPLLRASARLSPARTTGSFRASAQTKNESAVEVLGLVDAEMEKLAATAPSAEELKARKSTLVGDYGRELATSGGLADILGNLALYGVPLDEVGRYTGKVEAVTPAEVQAFTAKTLDPKAASVIVAGDAKTFTAPPEGQAAEPGSHPARPARPGQRGAEEGELAAPGGPAARSRSRPIRARPAAMLSSSAPSRSRSLAKRRWKMARTAGHQGRAAGQEDAVDALGRQVGVGQRAVDGGLDLRQFRGDPALEGRPRHGATISIEPARTRTCRPPRPTASPSAARRRGRAGSRSSRPGSRSGG
jgi:predicted Zn-dependent peptidase